MKFQGCSLFALAIALTSPAVAEDSGFYGGPFALIGWADTSDVERTPAQATPINDDSDGAGANGGGGVWFGYDFSPQYNTPVSLELSMGGRFRHDMNLDGTLGMPLGLNVDIQSFDIMATGLWNIPVQWSLKPYVGAGAGTVHHTVDAINFRDNSEWDFAWQLTAGATYPIAESIDLRVGYRYIDLGQVETSRLGLGETYSADVTSHDILIGAVWRF